MIKAGYILGLIGGAIMFIYGFAQIQLGLLTILYGGLSYYIPIWVPIITIIVTVAWGVLGVIGAIIGLRGNQIGDYLMLIAGIGGLAGSLIPIYMYEVYPGYRIFYNLNGTLLYTDVILMLLGGILSIALRTREAPPTPPM